MQNEPMLMIDDQGGGDEDAPNRQGIKAMLGLLRGRWHWAIILGVLLGVGGGFAGFYSEPDLYQAGSYIDIKEKIRYAEGIDSELSERYSTYVDRQIRSMTESEVIDVAMKLPEWREAQALRPQELETITTARQFSQALQIIPPTREVPVIRLTFVDRDPETAKAGLNALMLAYKRVHDDEMQVTNSSERQSLMTLLQSQQREEREMLDERARIIPEEDIPTLNSMLTAKLSALSIRERELETLNLRLGNRVNLNNGEMTPELLLELAAEDPRMIELQNLREAYENQLRNELEINQRGESHPAVQQLYRAIAIVERDILALENEWTSGEVAVSLPQEVVAGMAERDGLITTISQLNAEIDDLSRKKQAIDELTLRLDEIRERIKETRHRMDNHDALNTVASISDLTQVNLGPMAGAPTEPYNVSKRRQMAAAGGMAGLMMGFGMIMLVGAMDRRLRHVNDATAGMPHANVLGILPTLPANLKEPEQAEAAAHCVHHIRTLLQIGGNGRVFSVTSPTAGSGKSSLTSALGLSFAASDTKTLVIDCDLVGAGLSRRLGTVVHDPLDVVIRKNGLLSEEQLDRAMTVAAAENAALDMVLLQEGIMDEGEIERAVRLQRDTSLGVLQACAPGRLRSCVAAADVPNLFILPVGNARPADAGKLSPVAIRSLIQQAREDFDIVLIDTGPVLGSLEASIAAAEADGTVLIVSRGDQKALVTKSLNQLKSVHANVAGIVFNHALQNDLAHTSYASIVSQDRRPDRDTRRKRLPNSGAVARYGPLGSAVASYSEDTDADGNYAGNDSN